MEQEILPRVPRASGFDAQNGGEEKTLVSVHLLGIIPDLIQTFYTSESCNTMQC